MKLKVKQQIIGCLMAVILFFAGIGVEFPHAGLSFLHAKEVSTDRVSFICESLETVNVERICTLNMIRRDDETYLSSQGKSVIKRLLRSAAILYAVILMLCCISFFGKAADFVSDELISSRATIVHYIQQKDGKK